jgi:uncharacterized membrane protein
MSVSASVTGLTLAYWLHMAATVVWLGGLTTMALLVFPAARKHLSTTQYADFLASVQERLQQIGWLSMAVLGATGMFQMSASPNYDGFLAIENSWSLAILLKHAMIGLMLVIAVYTTWGVMPRIKRAALLRAAGKVVDEETTRKLAKQEQSLLRINLLLSLIVLALTAWARAS